MIEDFTNYLKGHSESIQALYCRYVRQFIQWTEPFGLSQKELGLQHFQGFIGYLQEEGIKLHLLNLALSSLRHYGYMLVVTGKASKELSTDLYIKGISKHPFPPLFSKKELLDIHESWKVNGMAGKRNKLILGMIIHQALTGDELGHLQPEHLNLATGKVKVPKTFAGKSRTLKLHKNQIPALQEYLEKTRPLIMAIREAESDKLFISLGESERFDNLTNKMRGDLKKQFPQFISYAQVRASVLYNWCEKYGLEKTIKMAGHSYLYPAPNR